MSLHAQALGRLGGWNDTADDRELAERRRVVGDIPAERERLLARLRGDEACPPGLTLKNLEDHLAELESLSRQLAEGLR